MAVPSVAGAGPPDTETLSRSALSGAAWSAVDRFAARGLSLITFIVLGRLLVPEDFGILAIAAAVIAFLSLVGGAGLDEAIIRSPAADKTVLNTAFWLATSSGVALTVAGAAMAGPLAESYGRPDLAPVLRMLSLTVVVTSLGQVQTAVLRRTFQFRVLAARGISATLAGSAVGITWAVISPSVWALVAQFVASAVVGTAILCLRGGFRPSTPPSPRAIAELLRFSVSVLGIRLLTFVSEQGDNVIVGWVLGATQLGYYSVGFRLYQIAMELVAGTLSAIGLPLFTLLHTDRPRLHRVIYRLTRISTFVAVLFFGVAGVLAEQVIPLLFGPQWAPSVPVMQALMFVGVINACTFFDRSVLLAAGRVRLELGVTSVAAVGNVIAYVIGAQFGIVGVAIALTVRAYLFWPLRLWALRTAVGLPIAGYLAQWVRPVMCGGGMIGAVVLVGTRVEGDATWVLQVVTALVTYAALSALIARPHAVEFLQVVRTLAVRGRTSAEHRPVVTSGPSAS